MRRLIPILISPILVLAALGCNGGESGGEPSKAGSANDAGVVHVHGLGVNPKDGSLYAATHTGLFHIPESGPAQRIAGRYQDTMGFTVVGPDHFLGSGHPDPRDYASGKLPSHLGLMESTDVGETWRNLSLSGKADFHALESAHGHVYGWDATSGAFMVSSEGKDWESRSSVDLFDFAVSPHDPDLVMATTGRGALLSRDGGLTWQNLSGPRLAVLAWPLEGTVFAVDVSGAVLISTDGGETWETVGSVGGPPESLLAHAEMLYVAVREVGILQSPDGGRTWQVRYQEPGEAQ